MNGEEAGGGWRWVLNAAIVGSTASNSEIWLKIHSYLMPVTEVIGFYITTMNKYNEPEDSFICLGPLHSLDCIDFL